MKTYKVLERHIGENAQEPYKPGDTRELSAADAKALVDLGLLQEVEDEPADAKAAPATKPAPAKPAK